jgi:outer membrane protein insertion porin family
VLAATATGAQIATGIHIVDVKFDGNTNLRFVDFRKCAADIKSRTYEGAAWLPQLAEHVQSACLQDNGYFKAQVAPTSQQLADKGGTHRFIVTFNIDAGPLYRLGEIRFSGNRVFSSEELRTMFDIQRGDVFRLEAVRNGISRMKQAYDARGYRRFTPVPDFSTEHQVISWNIDIDEGKGAK